MTVHTGPMITGTSGVTPHTTGVNSTRICPDLLAHRHLGAADSWRGHLVRAFFLLLRVVLGV